MGATAVAVAAIPDSATSVISACLKSKEGTIRIVDFQAGKRCLAGETLISWNQKGPQGAAGVQGLPGTPGAPGVAGTQGLQGPTGPAGSAGADGAPGADGVPGPAGPRGDGNKTISGIIDIKNSVTTKRGSGFDVSCSGPAFGYETNCTITFPADTWGAEGPVVWAGLLAANQPSNPPAWPGQGQVGVRIDSPTVVQLHTAGGYAFPQTIQFTAIDLANTSAAAATPLVKASNWGTLVGFSTSPRTPNVPVDLDSSTDWATLTAGQSHSCGIKADRSLWCWGDNFYGELGLGTQGQQTSSFSPARVGVDKDWSSIAAGLNFSCGTKTDHTLWCWGMDGVYGNLGIGLSAGVFGVFATPVQVTASRDWLSVVANMETACALKTDHSLWCWGSFESFDNGVQPFRAVPTAIDTATNWSSISLGGGFCGIKSDATLWCAGQNRDGQLGDGTSNARITPTRIGQERSWRNVSSGSWHTCAVAVDSSLWCWGQGSYGALGDGAIGTRTLPNQVGSDAWLQVSAGWGSTCGIKTDHTLWCWGYNGNGSAGVSSLLPSITTPTQVGTEVNWSLVVKSYQHAVGLQTYAN